MNSSKKLLLVVNPVSGTKRKDKVVAKATLRFGEAGFEVNTVYTTKPGDATVMARNAADSGFHGVIAVGGDGTVNEVARGLLGTETALGILPCGSGNGLARHVEESIDVDRAISIIADDHIEPCDYATANGTPFFCTCGMGFDAAVSDRFANMSHRGFSAYIKSTLAEFVHYRPEKYHIVTPDTEFDVEAFLIAACNASQYGNNAMISPESSIRDGLLDLVIVHPGTTLKRTKVGLDLMTGRLTKNLLVETLRVPEVSIRRRPAPAHLDGDSFKAGERVDVSIVAGGIRMFTNPAKRKFRPFWSPLRYQRLDLRYRLRSLFRR